MPLTAECTISTCAPSARRLRVTAAMLRQLGRLETLVPPNFSTIQGAALRSFIAGDSRDVGRTP